MIHNAVLYATSNPYYTNGESITPLTIVDGATLLERSLNALDHLGIRDVMVLTEDRILADERQRRNANHLTARIRWIPNGPNALKRAANAYPNQQVLITSVEVIFNPEMVLPLLERRDTSPMTLIDRRVSRVYDLRHARSHEWQPGHGARRCCRQQRRGRGRRLDGAEQHASDLQGDQSPGADDGAEQRLRPFVPRSRGLEVARR
jgi:hypothetical protein